MSEQSLETIYEADSQIEASVIENLLSTNGIACTIRNVGLPGVFGSSAGKNPLAELYQVLVKSTQLELAEQTILDYQSPDE